MSESQSRYSIVERLTKQKLQIMTSKSELSEEITARKQEIERIENSFKDWKEDIARDNKSKEREWERDIKRAKTSHINAKDHKSTKEKLFDTKIKVIDDALKKIEQISKLQPNK